jgi:hypothetical protein
MVSVSVYVVVAVMPHTVGLELVEKLGLEAVLHE